MNVGAFVCSCGCDVDLEGVRAGVSEVDVVASSELLCRDGIEAMSEVIDEYELDELVVTAPEQSCRRRIRAVVEEKGLHPDAAAFVDHRETSARVHDRDAATDKTARMIDARAAGRREDPVSRSVSRDAGERVAVVGDADVAVDLADAAEVTLIADGRDLDGRDDLEDVTVERGRVVDVRGGFGDFEVVLEARVTEACIGCMDCVREGPTGMVTSAPVDVHPDAPSGEWIDVCPTDAIDLDGVSRTLAFDQVIHPGGQAPPGGKLGFYTAPVDGATVSAVVSLLGGVEKPAHLDLEMAVCAAGESSQRGCTACTDACPHDAVARPAIDQVSFDEVACQNCGACTSACPTGATRLRDPSNERVAREVEALLDSEERGGLLWGSAGGIDTEVIAFVCSERADDRLRAYGRRTATDRDVTYPPILPVRVNCTDVVGEAHVAHALAAGADGVAILGCGEDCQHSGPDPKADLVERLNRATTDLGLGDRVGFFAPGSDGFLDGIEAFVDGLEPSPVPAGEHEATGRIDDERRENPDFDSHGWTLESVRGILEHVSPQRDVIRGLKDFGRMSVSEACNLTPTCSTLCPTDAIRRTEDADLAFNHERCVNCGLCEEGCPETAITMHDGLDLELLPENRDGQAWTTVHEGEMMECVRCGDAFASVGTAEAIQEEVGDLVEGIAPESEHDVFEYCSDCRSRLMFEGGEW